MKKGKLLNLIAAGCMFLVVMGTAKAVLADPDLLVGQGKAELFHVDANGDPDGNLLFANADFKAALVESPNHPQANFWYGLTRIGVLIQSNETVSLLTNFGFTKMDGSPLDRNALNPLNPDIKPPQDASGNIVLPSGSPNLEVVQGFLRNFILPEIGLSLTENFSKLNENFIDHVNMNMGNGLQEIDYGEVLACKTALNGTIALLRILCAYDTDELDIDDLIARFAAPSFSINGLLTLYTNLLKPLPDAGVQLAAAGSALNLALNGFLATIDFIQAETDDQSDDLIVIDETDPYIAEEIQMAQDLANSFITSLTGPTQIPVPSDSEGFNIQITLDLSEFMDNPINIRGLLPQFDANNEYIRSSFPDPTMAGVLPEMTQADWNSIFGIGPELSEPIINRPGGSLSVELNWEQEDDPGFDYYRIYRTTTPNIPASWAQIGSNISNSATTTFTDNTVNESVSRVYYYRLHTYYTSLTDSTYSDTEQATLVVYVNVNSASTDEDGSKENPYKDLGDAIRQVSNGTKVCVAAGTYYEAAMSLRMWNKNGLVLEGGYNSAFTTRNITANETIIDATGSGDWACIGLSNVSGVTVDGFTITGVIGQDWSSGIGIYNSSSILIKNCKITNCNRGIGIGNSSSAIIENCTIEGRKASGLGNEGISIEGTSTAEIKNCIITSNRYNGINITNNSSATFENCEITQNGSTGIYAYRTSSMQIINCKINNNNGKGISIDQNSSITCIIKDCYIAQNGFPGIVCYDNATVIISNNLVENNGWAENNNFGGIACSSGGTNISIKNNTIVGNKAYGIYCSNLQNIEIKNNNIYNNNGGKWGQYGIYGSATIADITHNNSYNNSGGNYVNCGTTAGQNGNISADPLFATGPSGNYYLSQIAAGQANTSPCIDAGSDTAVNLGFDNSYTTRTDDLPDAGQVDIGYHYRIIPISQEKGDINNDGRVNSADAILCLRFAVGLVIPTPAQRYAADMNNDGAINSADAIKILRKAVGLE